MLLSRENEHCILVDDTQANEPKLEQDQPAKAVLKNITDVDTQQTSDSQEVQTTTATPATTTVPTTAPTTTPTTEVTTTTTVSVTAAQTTAILTTATTKSKPTTLDTTTNSQPTSVSNTGASQGTASQTTVSSKANTKSEDTSKDGNEALQPGEVVYKEELTDKEHIKFIYSIAAVLPNVTLAAGINAGTFTDKGPIESMDDCIKSCGQTSNCDVAFKLGKQCFGVACYSQDTCQTKPAFSAFYNPLIAKIKHRTIKTSRLKGMLLRTFFGTDIV